MIQSFDLFLFLCVRHDLNNSSVFLGDLNSRRLCIVQFETKDFVAFLIGILAVEDADLNFFLSLKMLEGQLTARLLKIDTCSCLLSSAAKRDSLVLDRDLTIRTIDSLDLDVALFFVSGMFDDFLLLESEHTWLIIVENSDACAGILSNETQISLGVDKLNIEILIGLPVVIVFNLNQNFALFLAVIERNDFVDSFIVLSSFSIAVNGANANFAWLFGLVENLDFDAAASLTDRVMKAAEAITSIALVIGKRRSRSVFTTHNFVLSDSLFGSGHGNGLTMDNSLDQGGALQFLFQQVLVYFTNAGSSEVDVEELLHLGGDLLILFVGGVALLKWNEFLIELHGSHDRDAAKLLSLNVRLVLVSNCVLTILSVLSTLNSLSAQAVSNVGHDDQKEEETKGKVSLPLFDNFVEQADV